MAACRNAPRSGLPDRSRPLKITARFSGRKDLSQARPPPRKLEALLGQASLTALLRGKAHEIRWLLLLGFRFRLPAGTVSGPSLFVSGYVAGVAERGNAGRSVSTHGDNGNRCVGYRHTAPQLAVA